MKNIENKSLQHLDIDQYQTVLAAAAGIEKAFKRQIHTVYINPDIKNPNDIFSLNFSFDMNSIGGKK